jgi:hypothetical protein
MRSFLAALILTLLVGLVSAGTVNGPRSGNAITINGSVTAGNCTQFNDSASISDAGAPCATIDIGGLTTVNAVNANYVLGTNGADLDRKIAVNGAQGLAVFNVDLIPYTDAAPSLGNITNRFNGEYLLNTSKITFSDGVATTSALGFSLGVGPTFASTANALTVDVSGLTAARTATWPNAAGTVTLLGNTATGTGSVALAASPTFTGTPAAPTASTGTSTTQVATTAFVQAAIAPGRPVAAVVTTVSLTNQGADIASTNFTGANVAGLYRVSYQLIGTTADLSAGGVSVAIAWTNDGGAATMANSTNESTSITLTAIGSGSTAAGSVFVQLASGSISYSTSHTGLFGSAKYALYMAVERVL